MSESADAPHLDVAIQQTVITFPIDMSPVRWRAPYDIWRCYWTDISTLALYQTNMG
jgi:hypothetical protein